MSEKERNEAAKPILEDLQKFGIKDVTKQYHIIGFIEGMRGAAFYD